MKSRSARQRKTVVAFGETLWDFLPEGAVLGGAPFNFAYRVSSLGDRGVIVTRVGTDARGQKALRQMKALGMDMSFVQVDPDHATGTVKVALHGKRDPDYTIVQEVAYDFVAASAALLKLVARADCICFGTLAQRSARARRTLRQVLGAAGRKLKLLDINLRRDCFSPSTIEESLDRADILKMNLSEAHYLADLFEFSDSSLAAFCEELTREWNLSHCLVTLGEHGVFAATRKGEVLYEPGYQVKVLDTCGAGDAFSAGFIHRFLRGHPLRDCCRFGNVLGALVAGQAGGTQPVTPQEVQRFLKAPPPRIVERTLEEFVVAK